VFPRTIIGGVSVSRMIIGTNWFLGFSHNTAAKDAYLRRTQDAKKIADILEVFLNAGVDTLMGNGPLIQAAIAEAQQRTGKKVIIVSTPGFAVSPAVPGHPMVSPKSPVPADWGLDADGVARCLDAEARSGATICMPHQGTTDTLLDRATHTIRFMDVITRMIRERGMIPGLSTHMPEAIVYADETNLDVETYISIYNLMGFLMTVEVDWTSRIIHQARKPVICIKPMAAGHVRPFQAFAFVWNTIRDCDCVTVGTMSPDEARECIELSLSFLERRQTDLTLQETRSKSSVKRRA
jgi:hypothetical protein